MISGSSAKSARKFSITGATIMARVQQLAVDPAERKKWKPTPTQELSIRKLWNEIGVPASERRMPSDRMEAQKLLMNMSNQVWVYRQKRYEDMLRDVRPNAEQIRELRQLWEDLNVHHDKQVVPWTKEEAQESIRRMQGQLEDIKKGREPNIRG
ncbi:MAG: hypothetical protein QXY99_07760 [Thermoproteota archaeon]